MHKIKVLDSHYNVPTLVFSISVNGKSIFPTISDHTFSIWYTFMERVMCVKEHTDCSVCLNTSVNKIIEDLFCCTYILVVIISLNTCLSLISKSISKSWLFPSNVIHISITSLNPNPTYVVQATISHVNQSGSKWFPCFDPCIPTMSFPLQQ